MGDNGIRWKAETHFWHHVDLSGGPDACWPWMGARSKGGYGRSRSGGELAHRIAWQLFHGSIPVGLSVCHHCDNPPCCNPAHLFLGTHGENMADRHRKGRSRGPIGEAHPSAKLTEEDVREIRRLRSLSNPPTLKTLAMRYGVALQVIHNAAIGKTWRRIGDGVSAG
jgi:hypothetical protein